MSVSRASSGAFEGAGRLGSGAFGGTSSADLRFTPFSTRRNSHRIASVGLGEIHPVAHADGFLRGGEVDPQGEGEDVHAGDGEDDQLQGPELGEDEPLRVLERHGGRTGSLTTGREGAVRGSPNGPRTEGARSRMTERASAVGSDASRARAGVVEATRREM